MRTIRHGDISDAFINLGLTQADSLVRKDVPAKEGGRGIVPFERESHGPKLQRRNSHTGAAERVSDFLGGSKVEVGITDGVLFRNRIPHQEFPINQDAKLQVSPSNALVVSDPNPPPDFHNPSSTAQAVHRRK